MQRWVGAWSFAALAVGTGAGWGWSSLLGPISLPSELRERDEGGGWPGETAGREVVVRAGWVWKLTQKMITEFLVGASAAFMS